MALGRMRTSHRGGVRFCRMPNRCVDGEPAWRSGVGPRLQPLATVRALTSTGASVSLIERSADALAWHPEARAAGGVGLARRSLYRAIPTRCRCVRPGTRARARSFSHGGRRDRRRVPPHRRCARTFLTAGGTSRSPHIAAGGSDDDSGGWSTTTSSSPATTSPPSTTASADTTTTDGSLPEMDDATMATLDRIFAEQFEATGVAARIRRASR